MFEQEDSLELIINEALRSYAAPSEGLPERVLAGVRTRVRRRRILGAALGLAAAAAMACIFWLQPKAGPLKDVVKPREIRAVSHIQLPVQPLPERRLEMPRRLRTPRETPKLERFPAPTPMTREEMALVRFVTEHPKEAAEALHELNEPIRPIEIAAIKIEPLGTEKN